MSNWNDSETDNRVVIRVDGGVAEEVQELAIGAVFTYIVDFDDLKAATPQQRVNSFKEWPKSVRDWAIDAFYYNGIYDEDYRLLVSAGLIEDDTEETEDEA